MHSLHGKKILLGVTGSIAACKCPELVRRLGDCGVTVTVVMTEAAQRFVTPLTLRTLSGQPVYTDLFEPGKELSHLTLAEETDLLLIAPATANVIAKLASGVADDLLSTLFLAARGPVAIAPAMDGGMWDHPMTQSQLQRLQEAGVEIVGPEHGRLASGSFGMGRLADIDGLIAAAGEYMASRTVMAGETVLVTAGPTREPIDPVRFLSNRSSGKMGYAIARAAQRRGARVILISGPTALRFPPNVECVSVETAGEMAAAVEKRFPESTVLIMAAAVSDYRLVAPAHKKMARHTQGLHLSLESTPDILASLRPDRPRQILVGFAAETSDLETRATKKLKKKGLDLIAANLVGPSMGFDVENNALTLIDRSGRMRELGMLPKIVSAGRLLDEIQTIRSESSRGGRPS